MPKICVDLLLSCRVNSLIDVIPLKWVEFVIKIWSFSILNVTEPLNKRDTTDLFFNFLTEIGQEFAPFSSLYAKLSQSSAGFSSILPCIWWSSLLVLGEKAHWNFPKCQTIPVKMCPNQVIITSLLIMWCHFSYQFITWRGFTLFSRETSYYDVTGLIICQLSPYQLLWATENRNRIQPVKTSIRIDIWSC